MYPESHTQLAAFIWSVENLLRGDFKPSQYGHIVFKGSLARGSWVGPEGSGLICGEWQDRQVSAAAATAEQPSG